MAFTNITSNFSNESLIVDNNACDIFENSFPVKITKIFLFSLILLSSLVGNTLIIMIVYKRKELRKTTNYFIVNMAISDFVFPLQAIPVSLTQLTSGSSQWPIDGTTGLILCKLGNFLRRVSGSVSVQSLVWIAVDRFVAVVFPMRVRGISSKFRAFAIASTWVVAMVIHSFDLYLYELVEENQELKCTPSHYSYIVIYYKRAYIALFTIAPLIAMTILYCVIAVTLRRHDKALHCTAKNPRDQKKRRAFKMSLFIMAAFYICVLPMLFLNFFWEYKIEMSCSSLKELFFFGYFMIYLSSTINPIICMTFAQSYRHGLTEIFHSVWKKCLTKGNMEASEHGNVTLKEIRPTVRS